MSNMKRTSSVRHQRKEIVYGCLLKNKENFFCENKLYKVVIHCVPTIYGLHDEFYKVIGM